MYNKDGKRTSHENGYPHNQTRKGWECPRCGKVWAPFINACNCKYPSPWAEPLTPYNPFKYKPWTSSQEPVKVTYTDSKQINDEKVGGTPT